jgi:hypothetical protein
VGGLLFVVWVVVIVVGFLQQVVVWGFVVQELVLEKVLMPVHLAALWLV